MTLPKGLKPVKIRAVKRNKFGAVSSFCRQEHYHRSTGEAVRCNELHLIQKSGEISELKNQPTVRLLPTVPYKPDWTYTQKRKPVTEDFKGVSGERFNLIKKLWPYHGKGILRISKMGANGRCYVFKDIQGKKQS